jgi:hypothetical protein
MPEADFKDKRVFERMPVNVSLKFIDLFANKEGLAQTQDVSAKGLGLVSNEKLSPYTPLEMWLQMPDKSDPFYTRGEVVWSKKVDPDKYRVGVSLEKAELMEMSRLLRVA